MSCPDDRTAEDTIRRDIAALNLPGGTGLRIFIYKLSPQTEVFTLSNGQLRIDKAGIDVKFTISLISGKKIKLMRIFKSNFPGKNEAFDYICAQTKDVIKSVYR